MPPYPPFGDGPIRRQAPPNRPIGDGGRPAWIEVAIEWAPLLGTERAPWLAKRSWRSSPPRCGPSALPEPSPLPRPALRRALPCHGVAAEISPDRGTLRRT